MVQKMSSLSQIKHIQPGIASNLTKIRNYAIIKIT